MLETPRPHPARELPEVSPAEFSRRLAAVSPEPLPASASGALFRHYEELRRWNRRLSLVGPGTVDEIFTRHYGEALAALSLLPSPTPPPDLRQILDVGSGAGFPGFVLAAARPGLAVTLVEARERKWAFLRAAARAAGLPCRCLNARVELPLPEGVPSRLDGVTLRALKLADDVMAALAGRLSPDGRFILWVGAENPLPPPGWKIGSERPLPGSRTRRVVVLDRK